MTHKTKAIAATAPAQDLTGATSAVLPIATAALAGLFLIFAAGFAQGSVLHDSAHDQRHAIAFPCH
ncbi:MAG: cobalt transporter subunit CbtB [Halocynthiibacter sp.]|jgi:cobalt transporter subunit CbtB